MKLDKLIKITNGYPFESKSFLSTSKGIPVIKIKELKKNNVLLSKDTCYVNYNQSLSNYMLSNGDTLIALTGNPPSKGGIDAMVGRCSKYNLQTNAYLNQRVCKVESASPLLDNKYLFYFLSLDKTIMDLASRCSGSANQANISSNDIKDLEINLIDICDQQHIVNTIGSVDDLIENYVSQINNICSLLEQSLNRYAENCSIGNYSPKIIKSGINEFDFGKTYLDTSSVEGINNISGGEQITFEIRPSRANMEPVADSVWFAKMKESNKVLVITSRDKDLIDHVILSTGFLGIKASANLPLSFLTAVIISNDFKIQRDLNSVGTTMAGVNNETFSKITIPYLNEIELQEYDFRYKPLVERLSYLRREINRLKEIKDNLLKKYF